MPDDPKPNQHISITQTAGDHATQIGVVEGDVHVTTYTGHPPNYYAPFQPPPLPSHFVPRPEVTQPLKARMLAESESTPGTFVISAIHGLGGIGKSTLAVALARDAEIGTHFSDGVLWATLGQEPDILSLLSEWIQALGDHKYKPTIIEGASAHLRTLLSNKAALLVIDDAWDAEHVFSFCVGGPRCRTLVTTREGVIARAVGATLYDLDVMSPNQALALLAARLGRDLADGTERDTALALADAVGYLPLALELAAAQVADGVLWAELLEDLRQEIARLESLDDLAADQVRDEGLRKRFSLHASFQLSLRRLPDEQRARFAWLGVLPEDVSLTTAMTSTLWETQTREARRILRFLQDKALLQRGAPRPDGTPTYRVHDLLHDLARHLLTASPELHQGGDLPGLGLTLPQAHTVLLTRYRAHTIESQWHTLPPDGYVHAHLAWHMEKSEQAQELHALLREENAKGRNGWYEAREGLGQTAGYVQDVERAWQLADTDADWGLGIRYALVTASINSLAENLPIPLLVKLVQSGVWSPAQGLAYAYQSPDAQQRAEALTKLVPYLPEGLLGEALGEALAATRAIENEESRVYALAELVPLLQGDTENLLREALAVVQNVPKKIELYNRSSFQAKALVRLAPHLPKDLLKDALAAARTIEDENIQAEALLGLAPYLAEESLGETLAAVRNIPEVKIDEEHYYHKSSPRAETLVGLAPHLPERLLGEALAMARTIEDEASRAEALVGLVPRLPEELLGKALVAMRAIENVFSRVKVLVSLVSYIPKEVLEEALTAIHIDYNENQIEIQAELASLYPEEEDLDVAMMLAMALYGGYHVVLMELAPHLSEDLLKEALTAACAIEDEDSRAEALLGLAPHLPEELLEGALATACAIEDETSRADALVSMVPHLPERLLAEALTEVLAVEHAIENKESWAKALMGLAPYLPEELLGETLVEALVVARTITSEWTQIDILTELASHFPEDERATVLAEALTTVRHIIVEVNEFEDGESRRAKKLVELAPHLPEELLEKALEIAYWSERYQVEMLTGLAPHLSEQLLEEALKRTYWSEGYRVEMLTGLAPYLPERLLERVLTAVRTIEFKYEGDRAQALVRLVSYLPKGLLEEALAATRVIADQRYRAEVLIGLASHLSGELLEQVTSEALAVARIIADNRYRAKVLIGLVPHLSGELLEEATSEALAAASTIADNTGRAEVLMELVPHLSRELLEKAMPERLAAARAVANDIDEGYQEFPPMYLPSDFLEKEISEQLATALVELAPHLPKDLLRAALLEARLLKDEKSRAEALIGLAPHLPESKYDAVIAEALIAARAIEYAGNRAYKLVRLAPHLPKELLRDVLMEAMAAIIESHQTPVWVLGAMVSHFPEELLGQVLTAVHTLEHEMTRVWALVELAPHLPEGPLGEALAAAYAIEDERNRVSALRGMVPYLTEGLLQEALAAARVIADNGARAEILIGLAPHLSGELLEQATSEALAVARTIADNSNRAKVLIGMAPYLSGELLEEAISEALAAASTITGNKDRAEVLMELAPHLPEELLGKAMSERLAAARAITDDRYEDNLDFLKYSRGDFLQNEISEQMATALVELAPHLPKDLLGEALATARAIENEEWRAKALTVLAPYLSKELLEEALAAVHTIQNNERRLEALTVLLPLLPDKLLGEVLAMTCVIENEWSRTKALAGLVPHLVEFPPSDLALPWQEALPLLARRSRKDLLSDIHTLLPAIVTLGDDEAIAETFHAIQDVGRWWP
ncbi:MAG: apoptotic protease-activating factor 1 like protein [Chloroflexi bacterium]|nr:apoptotic protease-activating factor 1 like protein [Chloroflexota bacterium]